MKSKIKQTSTLAKIAIIKLPKIMNCLLKSLKILTILKKERERENEFNANPQMLNFEVSKTETARISPSSILKTLTIYKIILIPLKLKQMILPTSKKFLIHLMTL